MAKTAILLCCFLNSVHVFAAAATVQKDETDAALIAARSSSKNIFQLIYFERKVFADEAIGGVDRFLTSPDAFFACRARWEMVARLAGGAKDEPDSREDVHQEVARFKRFIGEKLEVSPPYEWLHFLQFGCLPSEITAGTTNLTPSGVVISLGDERYMVDVETSIDEGRIQRLDKDGKAIWSTELFSMDPYMGGVAGHFRNAEWCMLSKSANEDSLLLWGLNRPDLAFAIEFDKQTGKRINLLYLNSLEPQD